MRYEICREGGRVRAYMVDSDALGKGERHPVTHRVHHSPDGFEYGYSGSGPSDLARSILWDYLEAEPDPAMYIAFREDFIAGLNPDDSLHLIGESELSDWLLRYDEDEA